MNVVVLNAVTLKARLTSCESLVLSINVIVSYFNCWLFHFIEGYFNVQPKLQDIKNESNDALTKPLTDSEVCLQWQFVSFGLQK